jgi:hypothetical protein
MRDDLKREWGSLAPSDEATERARRAVLAAAPAPTTARRRRRPWSRRGGLAVALAALVVGAAATAAVVRPWDQEPRPSAANPQAEARILADPLLSELGWVVPGPFGLGHITHGPARPSLTFPPGVPHQAAMTRLYRSVTEEGVLPAEARLGPPLPAGRVVRYPSSEAEGVTLDLKAPFGYAIPRGSVSLPAFTLPAELPPEEVSRRFTEARAAGRALPRGAELATGAFPTCQVIRAGTTTPDCRLAPAPPDPWEGDPDGEVVEVPDVRGKSAGEAALALEAAGLRAFVMPVLSPEAAREATSTRSPVALGLVREAEAWRTALGTTVVSDDGEVGEVLDLYPGPGERLRAGGRVVLAARADDCAIPVEGATLQATCIPGAEAAREAEPHLRRAPWLYTYLDGDRGGPYRIQEARERPSLIFPSGVTRAEAIRSLYLAAVLRGRLPAEATLAPPLARGVVFQPPTAGRGVRIDLRAPFGYDPTRGSIFGMGFSFRADLTGPEIARQVQQGRLALLPTPLEDQVLPIPALATCQVGGDGWPGACPAAR